MTISNAIATVLLMIGFWMCALSLKRAWQASYDKIFTDTERRPMTLVHMHHAAAIGCVIFVVILVLNYTRRVDHLFVAVSATFFGAATAVLFIYFGALCLRTFVSAACPLRKRTR